MNLIDFKVFINGNLTPVKGLFKFVKSYIDYSDKKAFNENKEIHYPFINGFKNNKTIGTIVDENMQSPLLGKKTFQLILDPKLTIFIQRCNKYSYKGKCVTECPPNTYIGHQNMCVDTCNLDKYEGVGNQTKYTHGKKCVFKCPPDTPFHDKDKKCIKGNDNTCKEQARSDKNICLECKDKDCKTTQQNIENCFYHENSNKCYTNKSYCIENYGVHLKKGGCRGSVGPKGENFVHSFENEYIYPLSDKRKNFIERAIFLFCLNNKDDIKSDKARTKCCSTIGKTYLGGEKDGNRLGKTKEDRYRKTFGYCNSGRDISRDNEDLRNNANKLTNFFCEDNINGCNEGRYTGPMCESGGPCVKFGGENAYGLRCYAKKDNNGNLKRIDQDSKECHSERTLLATPTGN